MMTKHYLLSSVAAIALIAGVNGASACQGNECTRVNSTVAGNAQASGSAFEKVGAVAVGRDAASVGVVGFANSHSASSLQRDVNCTSGCITGQAVTQNQAGYAAQANGDLSLAGGFSGTNGQTSVNLTGNAANGNGEYAAANVHTGATAATLVNSLDAGFGSADVAGGAYTGAASLGKTCAEVSPNLATAYTLGVSEYANDGFSSGLFASAGSHGATLTTTLAATSAADAELVNTECLISQCYKDTPMYGVALTGGDVISVAAAGSLDGDLAFNGAATTGSTGLSFGTSTLESAVSMEKTYGQIGEKKEWKVTKWFLSIPIKMELVKTPIMGVNGLTGTAETGVVVEAGAQATGDLSSAFAFETKEVGSEVQIGTVGNPLPR